MIYSISTACTILNITRCRRVKYETYSVMRVGVLHVSIRRRHELEILDLLQQSGKSRCKVQAMRYETQIHMTSATVDEYLARIERLKTSLVLLIPDQTASSSQDLAISPAMLRFMIHVQPLIDRVCAENHAIALLMEHLLTSDDKPVEQQIEIAKIKGKSSFGRINLHMESLKNCINFNFNSILQAFHQ